MKKLSLVLAIFTVAMVSVITGCSFNRQVYYDIKVNRLFVNEYNDYYYGKTDEEKLLKSDTWSTEDFTCTEQLI
ncbi:MAG: hypothetical protein MJ179_07090 [Treponema sp.]|nr:hypothetical protein [Treponema sp.]